MAKAKLTPEGWRCEKKSDHLLRAKWMDYRDPAVHLLTMVTTDRQPILGTLVAPQDAIEQAHIERTPLGEKIAAEIERIPSYKETSSIELYRFIIMPDHVHIMLQVHDRLPKHLGQYVRWFKRQCSAILAEETKLAGIAARVEPNNVSVGYPLGVTPPSFSSVPAGPDIGATPPSSPSSSHSGPTLGATPPSNIRPLFAPEYHDRVLTSKNQLQHMKRYILDNPRRLALKRANPDLFRIRQHTRLGRTACVALGNIFLAEYPQRAVLQCSRRMTQEEIDTKREECLYQAANGVVYISGAISEGEKQISRALREAGYPLIILLTEGFPEPDSPNYKYFKPQGVYFEACAAGKLLLVQPDKEILEQPEIATKVNNKVGNIPHDSQRYRFVAMNIIADDLAEL